MTSAPAPALTKDVAALAALFVTSGATHVVKPEVFERLMPSWVPAHRTVIIGSGVAELLCAAGLLMPRFRRTSGWASAVLLIGVYPGNVKMAGDAAKIQSTSTKARGFKAVAFGRLPLQLPMIRTALKAARG